MNLKNKKSFFPSALIYTIGTILVQGINFFITPVLTRILTPTDYGITSIYTLWVLIFGYLIGLAVDSSINNAKIAYEDSIDSYISSITTISIISFSVILFVVLLFQNFFGSLLNVGSQLVVFIIIQSFFSFCFNIIINRFIVLNKPFSYLTVSMIKTILIVTLTLILVLSFKTHKYLGQVYATTAVSVILGSISLIFIYLRGKTLINIEYWKFCLPLSLPLIFHGISGLILVQADRYMLSVLTNEHETGIYSFVYTLGQIINVISLSFNNAWVPWYYDKTKRGSKEEIIGVYKKYSFIITILTIMYLLFSPEVVRIMGSKDFSSATGVLPIIIVSYFFSFLYTFPVNYEFYHKKTVYVSVGTTVIAAVNLLLNFILIPYFSVLGAAIATLISYFLLFILHYLIAKFVLEGFQIPIKLLILPSVVVLVVAGMSYILTNLLLIRLILVLILLILVIILLVKNKYLYVRN